jgi:hypothetical protein
VRRSVQILGVGSYYVTESCVGVFVRFFMCAASLVKALG